MSVLANKRIVIVGDVNSQLTLLKNELESRDVKVSELACSNLSAIDVSSDVVDLIFFNYLHNGKACEEAQSIITTDNGSVSPVPIFTLVTDTSGDIQKALASGAADYITEHESLESIIQKIEAVFSEADVFSNSSAIDITPIEANVSATGIRVFVVEDAPLLRNLLAIRLEKSRFPFAFSKDGKDILPIVKQFKPDVVVLDLMLPGISGFDILKEMKSDESMKKVPVLVFSNKDGAEDRRRAKELGAAGFYVKAMTDLSELVETIEALTKK